MRLDQALLGELTGASRGVSVAPVATGKVTLVEIRFDSVGCCEVLPALGLWHRSFEVLDLLSHRASL
jgi:hypothetical protein